MTLIPRAKRPATAVARALRDLGLTQGKDFRVAGRYQRGARTSTDVRVLTDVAEQIIADNADLIERRTEMHGYRFTVSIAYSPGAPLRTTITNDDHITRVREQPSPDTVLREGQPGEDAGHCAQCSRLLIWDRTGKRVHDEQGEYLCYGPDRVSSRSSVHLLSEQPGPEQSSNPAAEPKPADEVSEPGQQTEQPKSRADDQPDQHDELPDFLSVRPHHNGKAGEYEVLCTRCEEADRKFGRRRGRGERPGRVPFRWGLDSQADAERAAWSHTADHRTWARRFAEQRERELLHRQARALRWSEADARTMQCAASASLGWWMLDGKTTTYYHDRYQRGAGPRVARGRVQALIAAGLLTEPNTDNPNDHAIRPTRDGQRALQAWNLCKPDPVARTRKQDAEARPYLINGEEHRRRREAAQRQMEESRRRCERYMLEYAARREREEAEEELDAQWRKEHGILNPFAKRPADWHPKPDPLDAALAQETARSMSVGGQRSPSGERPLRHWAQRYRFLLPEPERALETC